MWRVSNRGRGGQYGRHHLGTSWYRLPGIVIDWRRGLAVVLGSGLAVLGCSAGRRVAGGLVLGARVPPNSRVEGGSNLEAA